MTDDHLSEFERELSHYETLFGLGPDISQTESKSGESLFAEANDEQTLRKVNADHVGPDGRLTKAMKLMRYVPKDRKREFGQRCNRVKGVVSKEFDSRLVGIAAAEREAELSGPMLDVTLPGTGRAPGRPHPISRIKHELLDIFESMGFEVADGPEIDLTKNCFEMLGFPPDHPATDMQDTFYITDDTVLRTHTSTIQVRQMQSRKPPLAVVAPGTVFRRDDDATHSPMFFQLEGFVVDTDITFADLKGTLTLFLRRVFGEEAEVRFRPSYFPFVEPGGEVDVRRPGQDWMEILGCGMIHPTVLKNVGYDPDEVQGFAFGLGLDRIAMIKYGIPNIKALYENDVRFLGSF